MKLRLNPSKLRLFIFFCLISSLFNSAPSLGQDSPSPSPSLAPEKQSQDPTFEEIFKKPRNENQRVIVPFFIDGQQRGQVLLTLGNSPTVRIQAAPLLAETEKVIRPDIQGKLTSAVDNEGNLSLEILLENGLQATFDRSKLELQIQVPPAQLRTNVANLNAGRLPPDSEKALLPSTFSGYVNFRADKDYIWSGSGQTNIGLQPLRLAVDGTLNYKNWVFEGRGNFTEARKPALIRGDLRVVRDAPAEALRYVVGDLALPITGYQNSKPQLGISVAKNFSLQPYLVTRPISQFEFFLEKDSLVDVLVNGRLQRTLQLPAGKQDIRDLPLNTGTNDVELVIKDDVGRVQRLNFYKPVAGDLLAPGVQQFAYSLGVPSIESNGDRTYDFTQPILTLSHRLGLTNQFTGGTYIQADFQQQLAGLEGIFATNYGNLGWDLALSHDQQLGIDYAGKLRYEYLQVGENNPSQRSFRLTVESKGRNFVRVGEAKPRNDFLYDITANYSQKLFGDMRGNLSTRYQFGRDIPNTYRFSLGLSRTFRNGLNVNLNLSQNLDRTGFAEQRANINFSWTLPRSRQSIQASSNINNKGEPANRLNWNYNPLRTIGTPKPSLSLTQNNRSYNFNGRLSYTGYRFDGNLSHDAVFPRNGNNAIANTTKFNFGTALVFADGYFGWSRPLNNSFALVIPKDGIKGQEIGINPSSGGYTTRIDNLGFGVVPNLSPYNISTVIIDAPNLPVGMDLGDRVIKVLPSYNSGTLVRVGTDATVFLRGVLLNANGEPISLQSAEIIAVGDRNWQPVTIFTNKSGKFATSGLKPGRYEIRLFTNPPAVIPFAIPSDAKGIYDVGTLKITPK
ncbi:fimbria/pilus outer membrane usher protein [Sphaerospermopsis sp. LEGE 08334]|uniref:fimbria/pilus outer membrane usher protein n=1 Tax=Sphaerospermopsis sp. LEGE 08334 TaxID=1828651 RepID=UPI0018807600|nr:fimbria/pilus outer membrane usher protein [Sphaerospermopsis sp. LEGE 08334]MBE9058942.1 fimbria/pilus outer membrane usher protein [Sphaerospermopsis sp. LEGE 08334]